MASSLAVKLLDMALLKSQTLHEEQTRTKTCKKYGKFATKNDFECFVQKKRILSSKKKKKKKKKKFKTQNHQKPFSWDPMLEANKIKKNN